MPKSKSSRKPTTKTTASAKPAATSAAPKTAAVVASVKPVVEGPVLKKKELIERVVAASGLKKKDVKPAVEATLAVLGRALGEGEELNLQPLGKIKVKNKTDKPNGTVINCRIRQSSAAANPAPGADGGTIKLATVGGSDPQTKDPLAEPAE